MTTRIVDSALTKVIGDVLSERIRQIDEEGFKYERDDQYKNGELAQAASAYAALASQCPTARQIRSIPGIWPVSWDESWFKTTNPRHELVKAAALIVAEIERLDRLEKKG